MSDLAYYEAKGREAVDAANGSLFIHWRDEDVGRTVAPVLGGESDDPLHRANLDAALEILSGHVEAGTVEDGIVSKSGHPWVTHLQVQVFTEAGTVTQAWIDTVDEVLDPLEDYPVLDDLRFSDYEHEEYVEGVHMRAATEGLADLLLDHTEPVPPDEYDHDLAVENVARDYLGGRLTITDEDTLDGLAMDARTAARHLRLDAEHRTQKGLLISAAIILETVAESIDPE